MSFFYYRRLPFDKPVMALESHFFSGIATVFFFAVAHEFSSVLFLDHLFVASTAQAFLRAFPFPPT